MSFWAGVFIGWAVCSPLTVLALVAMSALRAGADREGALADFDRAHRAGDGAGQARAWKDLERAKPRTRHRPF